MATNTADALVRTLREDLNALKKNLDQFDRLTATLDRQGQEAAKLLDTIKTHPDMTEARVFAAYGVPAHTQRFIKASHRPDTHGEDRPSETAPATTAQ